MTDPDTSSVRDALSACGLFAAAEIEELAAEAGKAGKPGAGAEAKSAGPAANGSAAGSGSILDELDRVLPNTKEAPARDARPAPAAPPPPPRRAPEPRADAPKSAASAASGAAPTDLEDLLERTIASGGRSLHLDAEDGTLRARARVGAERTDLGAARASEVDRLVRASLKLAGDAPLPASAEITLEVGGRARGLFVATLSTIRGTRFVFSGFDDDRALRLDALGFEPEPLEELREALNRTTGGLVLLGSPKGHGASSTLRASSLDRARAGRLVVTLDGASDPSTGVLSVPVTPGSRGRVEAIAHALSHDPDVLVAGRLTSPDEASAAIQAAAEGRLVLASILARSAADAATMTRSLGVDPFLLAAAQPLLVGQRLARALCAACRERETSAAQQLRDFGFEEDEVDAASLYKAVGCSRCNAGYRDRFLLMETAPATRPVFEAIREGAHGEALEKRLGKGRLTLRGCAIRAISRGRTTLDEAARAIAG